MMFQLPLSISLRLLLAIPLAPAGTCLTDADCVDDNVCAVLEECFEGVCLFAVADPCWPPDGLCPCTTDADCFGDWWCDAATQTCQAPPCPIPTASAWGMTVLTLLLLTAKRVHFHRPAARQA